MNHLISNLFEIKCYLTPPIIALLVNFSGTLLIFYATGAPGNSKGLSATFAGAQNVLLVHPYFLRCGLSLLAIGFLILLIFEIVKVRKVKQY